MQAELEPLPVPSLDSRADPNQEAEDEFPGEPEDFYASTGSNSARDFDL